MKIIVLENYQELSRKGAEMIQAQLKKNPHTVLGLATGSTPIGLYKELINMHEDGLDFALVKTFNLDEYVGLGPDHPASYRYYMEDKLFSKINVNPDNVHVPNGVARDLAAECTNYEAEISKAGGIDFQILGIGHNGHIGFNEPGTDFDTTTQVVDLTPSTIEANARFFETQAQVPTQAISMGIKSIMKAKEIVLLASGVDKAEAIYKAAEGKITPDLPASVLQLHPNVTLILDKQAASLLSLANR